MGLVWLENFARFSLFTMIVGQQGLGNYKNGFSCLVQWRRVFWSNGHMCDHDMLHFRRDCQRSSSQYYVCFCI